METKDRMPNKLAFMGRIFPPYDSTDARPNHAFRPSQTVVWRCDYLGDDNEKVRNPIRNDMGFYGVFKITDVDGNLIRIAKLSQTPINGQHEVEKEVVVPAFYLDYNNDMGHDG